MKCLKCQKELNDGAKFCPYCGSKTPAGNEVIDNSDESISTNERCEMKKRGKKKIAIAAAICVIAAGFACGCVIARMMGGSEYAAVAVNYSEVNTALADIASSDEYINSEASAKAEMMIDELLLLEGDGKIYADSIAYDEVAQIISYEYADGAYGAVMLESFDENSFGYTGAESYVAEYDEAIYTFKYEKICLNQNQ